MLFMSTFKCKASRENEKAFYFLILSFFLSFALHVSNRICCFPFYLCLFSSSIFISRLLSRCLTYICNRIPVHFAHLYCNINSFNLSFFSHNPVCCKIKFNFAAHKRDFFSSFFSSTSSLSLSLFTFFYIFWVRLQLECWQLKSTSSKCQIHFFAWALLFLLLFGE